MKFVLGDWVFPTKGAARKAVSKILNDFTPGQTVEDPCTVVLLTALLCLHPEAEEKFGAGIRYFYVARDSYGSQGFRFVRVDGTQDNFSYIECFEPRTARSYALRALRNEVTDQVLDFKNAAYGFKQFLPCAITGELVAKEDCHVDHEIQFWTLADAFADTVNAKVADFHVDDTPRGIFRPDAKDACFLVDREIAARWVEYHRAHAVLRITSKKANLTRPRT